jgi:poly(beta-D-mannuronate) lyase
MPKVGYQITDPKLARDASGVFHLLPGSPAINKVSENYLSIATDMDGQARIAPFDAGADEVSKDKVKAHILSANDVGQGAIISHKK